MEICTSAFNNLLVCRICEYNWNIHINFNVPQKNWQDWWGRQVILSITMNPKHVL